MEDGGGKVFKCVKLVVEDNWETVVGWARILGGMLWNKTISI